MIRSAPLIVHRRQQAELRGQRDVDHVGRVRVGPHTPSGAPEYLAQGSQWTAAKSVLTQAMRAAPGVIRKVLSWADERRSCCGSVHPRCRSGGEVVPQPLCPGLTDAEFGADRRIARTEGHPVRRELSVEQLSRPLLQRVAIARALGRRIRRNLGTTDDHHEELIGADQRDRRPRSHRRLSDRDPSRARRWPRASPRSPGRAAAATAPEPPPSGARHRASPSSSRR